MTDPIADMIVRIKNTAASKKDHVVFPMSKKTLAVAQTLERAGYIEIIAKKGKRLSKSIEAKLVYAGLSPRFKGARRLSHISKRVYQKIKNVLPVKNNFGSLILSTSKGILTDKEARKENTGGETLFQIW